MGGTPTASLDERNCVCSFVEGREGELKWTTTGSDSCSTCCQGNPSKLGRLQIYPHAFMSPESIKRTEPRDVQVYYPLGVKTFVSW